MNENQTILLVDDREDDLFLMRMAFQKAAAKVALQEVHNGVQAIAYLNGDGAYNNRDQFPLPAVMLLDLNMPMKNGFDVLNWVRAQPVLKRMCIIILTASSREEDVERAFDAGAHSFLVKPATIEELVAMIRSMLDWLQYNRFPPLNAAVRK